MENYILSESEEHQKLIALVSLLLAAKSEDIDEKVPSIKDLLRIVDLSNDLDCDLRNTHNYSLSYVSKAFKEFSKLYCKLEFLIFESILFNAIRPTAVTFINVFQHIVVTEADLKDIKTDGMTWGNLHITANEYITQLQDIILLDIDICILPPSFVAASIIAATRKLLSIGSYWNEDLANLTCYKADELEQLMYVLIGKHSECIYKESQMDSDEAMIDSGFISDDSVSQTDDEKSPMVKKRKFFDRPGITLGVHP